jgi:hypothetical protein
MMSYNVLKNVNNNYDIYEKESEVLIEINGKERDVRSICRKLNLGAGFNGWTPEFFGKKYK